LATAKTIAAQESEAIMREQELREVVSEVEEEIIFEKSESRVFD
jgi:hypothetical protein